MRRVLCAVDESCEAAVAIDVAASLADRLGEPLVLVHVLPYAQPAEAAFAMGPMPQRDLQELEHRRREEAERLLDRLAHGGEHETLLLVGEPSAALLDEAAREPTSLLVVGARARGRFGRAVLGSVSGRVAAHADCPVVVVPHAAESFRAGGDGPVVCAVDGSAEAEAGAVVAARAAERLGRELILTHVLHTGTMLDEAAAREGTVLLQTTAGRIEPSARLSLEPQVGSVAATLAAIAARERAALLVVGSRGRGPVHSALLGSVSTGVVLSATCPVVIVSPDAQNTLEPLLSAVGQPVPAGLSPAPGDDRR